MEVRYMDNNNQTGNMDAYWSYPEGFEKVKALIDFLPEEEREGYLVGIINTIMDL